MKTKINEIFSSIQGEGTVIGCKQLFIRFCTCNLHCDYCDTKFQDGIEYTADELYKKITKEYNLSEFHSISLTGGEPLLSADFLKEFLPLVHNKVKIYLETNATLPEKLKEVKPYIDIIAADIKLESSTGVDTASLHKNFFEECSDIKTFAKIVFDENITEDEINSCLELVQDKDIELILQPKMIGNKLSVSPRFCMEVLDKFCKVNPNTRLIPQMHKFLGVD